MIINNFIRFIMLTEDEIKELKFEEGLKKLEELVTPVSYTHLTLPTMFEV